MSSHGLPSTARAVVWIAALLFAVATEARAQRSLVDIGTVQLPDPHRVEAAERGDVDGDGRLDLVIAAYESGVRYRRSLRVYYGIEAPRGSAQGSLAFEAEPRHVFEATQDVTAFALADVHRDPGLEVVLFNGRGAFSWRPGAPEGEALARLLDAEFLWQLADEHDIYSWASGVRDLDGDGLDDLILPEPTGYRIAIQRRVEGRPASFDRVSAPRVPLDPGSGLDPELDERGRSTTERSVSVGIRISSDDPEADALVKISEAVPVPNFVDWDGDGDLDLWAQSPKFLHVWVQDADGRFSEAPQSSSTLPVVGDRSRRLDPSYSSHVEHLNRDRRGDYVVFGGDRRSDDVRTQCLVYSATGVRSDLGDGSDLFGEKGRPEQLLVFAGFVVRPQFEDVDGDGLADLCVSVIRPDLIDQLRSAASGHFQARLYVYLNRGQGFSKKPDLEHRFEFGAERGLFTAQFVPDVTGDGVADLLLRDEPDRLRLLYVRRQKEGFEVMERALWEYTIDERARLVVPPQGRLGPREVLVLERRQVLVLRFGQ